MTKPIKILVCIGAVFLTIAGGSVFMLLALEVSLDNQCTIIPGFSFAIAILFFGAARIVNLIQDDERNTIKTCMSGAFVLDAPGCCQIVRTKK